MPYTINWYIPDEIIYVRYIGVMTIDELRESFIMMQKFIESSPRELVHVINDMGDMTQPVPLTESIKVVREVGGHDRTGWTYSIREASPLVKMGSMFGSSIFKIRFRAFDTLEEALEHLRPFDTVLSWDKVEPHTAEHLQG